MPSFPLQQILERQFQEIPRTLLRHLIAKKLRECGVNGPTEIVEQLTSHVLNGSHDKVHWNDESNDEKEITLSFTESDVKEVEAAFSRFADAMPAMIDDISTKSARVVLKTLRAGWDGEYSFQLAERQSFEAGIERRWGKALGMLRMLLTIAREFGDEVVTIAPSKKATLESTLIRLHVRACQVTSEIITLLENGYADGAMARWRTLHEISVVMILLKEHGEELAKRYLAHLAVDAKTAKDMYSNCSAQLGYQPLSPSECRRIDREYDAAIAEYGKNFRTPYGWAFGFVPKGQRGIGLGELEAAAGKSALASHYKLASQNVHAGPHALFFRLGLLGESGLLAGASNAGLTEPGQNTAISLTQISILLGPADVSLDVLVTMKLMQSLRDEIAIAFSKADKKLQADHERITKNSFGHRSHKSSRPSSMRKVGVGCSGKSAVRKKS